MSKIQKIYSQRIALRLDEMGNPILYSEPNKKYPRFQVFIFRDSDKFQRDWNKLK